MSAVAVNKVKKNKSVQLRIGNHSVMEPCTEPAIDEIQEDSDQNSCDESPSELLDQSDPRNKYHVSKYPAFGNVGRSELAFELDDLLEKKTFGDCFSLIPSKKLEENSNVYIKYNTINKHKTLCEGSAETRAAHQIECTLKMAGSKALLACCKLAILVPWSDGTKPLSDATLTNLGAQVSIVSLQFIIVYLQFYNIMLFF
jgi:hypothetical protein